MKVIPGDTIAEVWVKACCYLLDCRKMMDTNVILNITQPALVRQQDAAIAARLDAFLLAYEQYSNHTVAETIFPGYEYVRRGVDGVYNVYPDVIYPRIAELKEVERWGTYAHRLLRRVDKQGVTYNPLEKCVEKMRDRKPKKASYELGFGFGFDLATYDDDEDRADRMGLPCLSHLSFKVIDGAVHLTAMYRSHYYIHRGYGNLLGLARLQSFVAEQSSKKVGSLVCHSTLARVEVDKFPWKKADVQQLVSACAEMATSADD
jgi:hypothetical protein